MSDALEGGCKHGIAFVFWLLRISEEESVTQMKCYWKKAALTSLKTQSLLKHAETETCSAINMKHAC